MKKQYPVNLTDTERDGLKDLLAVGRAPARKLMHARILLNADQSPQGTGEVDDAIAKAVRVSQSTVFRVRRHYVEHGLEAALNRRPPGREYQRDLYGDLEAQQEGAQVIALASAAPRQGEARWSLRLLADKLVELEVVDASISSLGSAAGAQEDELKRWQKKEWFIPPQASGEFVWRIEDVLEVYTRPYDPSRPVVCMDEVAKQLLRDTRLPLPPATGHAARVDYRYEWGDVVNCFLFCEPLRGQRWVNVTERRTKLDWAHQIRELVDGRYRGAERIALVLDKRKSHTPAAFYDAFAPAEAKRLTDIVELHYTPTHGSWLNIAEIELRVLSGQCLDRRVPDAVTLQREVSAWQYRRNVGSCPIDWRFTTQDARIQLKRLYPSNQE